MKDVVYIEHTITDDAHYQEPAPYDVKLEIVLNDHRVDINVHDSDELLGATIKFFNGSLRLLYWKGEFDAGPVDIIELTDDLPALIAKIKQESGNQS